MRKATKQRDAPTPRRSENLRGGATNTAHNRRDALTRQETNTMHTTAALATAYQTLPLSSLRESDSNPRRTFDESKLRELAESIRTHGLIQPITVRPKDDAFEIVAGARRFRALQIADHTETPVRILELTDAQALEVQIIENSQRQDVHPYEEAAGYQRLLDLPGYDVAALSQKCGKSESHIYTRLALLQLVPEVAEAFQQDRITASHANQIARIPHSRQAEAFEQCFRKDWQDKESHLLPAKHLVSWLNQNIYLPLTQAPFEIADATLLPEAGACLDCPKRSGFNTRLFADVTTDVCLDGGCYQRKVSAFIQITLEKKPELATVETEWRKPGETFPGALSRTEFVPVKAAPPQPAQDDEETDQDEAEEPTATCSTTREALVTHGAAKGRIIQICSDRSCPVHFPQYQQEVEDDPERVERERQREEQQAERQRIAQKREATFRRVLANVPASLPAAHLRLTLRALVDSDEYSIFDDAATHYTGDNENNQQSACEVLSAAIAAVKDEELPAVLVRIAFGGHVAAVRDGETDYLTEAAKLFIPKSQPKTKAVKPERNKRPKAA